MTISVHCLVKNEENFIWFAINSVIDYVEEILVWDTDSDDKTVEIIKSINNPKVKFEERGRADARTLVKLRQEMLQITKSDWILILDGDELWPEQTICDLRFRLQEFGKAKDLVVVPNYMLVGDIFHHQEDIAGKYKMGGKVGHYNIRAIRKSINGLHVKGVYPNEAYTDGRGVKVQDFSKEKILFLEDKYLHASFLARSSINKKKIKYELGEPFPLDFYYPEVFFKPRPNIVPSPWKPMNSCYKFKAFFETPLKKIKRRIV